MTQVRRQSLRAHRVMSTRGEYVTTTLSVDPYSPKDRRKALAIIHETEVWKELLLSQRSHRVNTQVLELPRFARAYHEFLEALARRGYFVPSHHPCVRPICDCPGTQIWCKHAYALCYVLIHKCEVAPETFLAGLGLDLARSLAEDHCGGEPTLGRPVIDLSLSPTVVVKTEEPEGNKKRRVSRYVLLDNDEWENSSQGLYSHQPIVLD